MFGVLHTQHAYLGQNSGTVCQQSGASGAEPGYGCGAYGTGSGDGGFSLSVIQRKIRYLLGWDFE